MNYNPDMYKSLKICVGAIIKNPEILKFVPDHLKVNQSVYIASRTYNLSQIAIKLKNVRSSHQRCSVKKDALRNVAKFTGKQLCQSLFFNKFLRTPPLTEHLRAIVSEMCDKVVDMYPSAKQFVPERYNALEMSDKTVNTCPFVFGFVFDSVIRLKKCVIKLFPNINVVNGLIPRDAINTKRRQKLLEVNKLLQDKCTNCTSVYFLKPDTYWTALDGGLNKIFYCKYNIHILENGNKKLALSIKTKLDNIGVNCHEITINEKVVPTVKAVDYQRADYQRAITTSLRNWQSNSTIKRNAKLRSPKCQLNFKTSTI